MYWVKMSSSVLGPDGVIKVDGSRMGTVVSGLVPGLGLLRSELLLLLLDMIAFLYLAVVVIYV